MFRTRTVVRPLVFCLLVACGSSVSVVNSNAKEYECPAIEDDMRKDCGFPGITREQCIERACCFKPTSTPGVPWCYTEKFDETTTSTVPTTTTASTTMPRTTTAVSVQAVTLKPIPHWIKVLMNATTDVNAKKANQPSSGLPLLTLEIRNELMCQNTYRLFRKVRGASKCQMNLNERVSCIGRDFARKAGESECEVCTKLNCCYDPVVKAVGGERVPHCYKTLSMISTTPAPTTTTTASTTTTSLPATEIATTAAVSTAKPLRYWAGIRPEYQPGSPPRIGQPTGNVAAATFPNGNPAFGGLSQVFGQTNPASQNVFPGIGGASANANVFNILSSLRRPMSLPTTVNPAITNFLQLNTAKPTNALNALSLLNRPKDAAAGSSSNALSSVLSLLGRPKQTPNPASSNNLLTSLLSGFGRQQSSSGGSNNNNNNLLNTLSLLQNKPSGATASRPNVINIFGSPFEEEPVAAAPLATEKPSSQGSHAMSQVFSNFLKPSGTGGSSSTITDLLLNRLRPSTSTTTTSSSSSSGGVSSLITQLLGNSPQANLITSLLGRRERPSAPKASPEPEVTRAPATTKPKVVVPSSIGIPVIFEEESRPMPPRTCYPKNCGHRATDGQITHRIVGGQWSGGIQYWPWMASFRRTFFDDDRFIHICGATIISRRWIVTAGHCFMAYKRRGLKLVGQREKHPSVYAIHVGKYYRDSPEPTMQVFEIESYEAHPEYDFRSLKHDIAVAKLKESIQYSSYVQPACLPEREDVLFPGEKAWVTGWGETLHVGDQNKSKLKELTLPLIGNNKCRSFWPNHFHEAWICTEGAYLEDACAGDSGGPLVIRGDDARWDLIGIAIAGTRTCSTVKTDIKPGIYTKLAYYRDFIDVATGGACNEEYKFF